MIKEALFCNICERHVYDNNSISFHIVQGMAPTVDIRNDSLIKSDVQPTDTTLCEFCEQDIYAILQARAAKRKIEENITG